MQRNILTPWHTKLGSEVDAVLKRPFGFEDIGARCDLRKAVHPVQSLEGESWIKKVFQLAQSVGHKLLPETDRRLVVVNWTESNKAFSHLYSTYPPI